MEHSYIEDRDIAGRYLMGKLSAEERMRFEEHLENCVQCLDRLATIDGFRNGLRIVAVEEVERAHANTRARLLSRVDRFSRASRAAVLAGILLLIASPLGWVILELRGARRDLVQATQTAAEWQRKYEEREQAARNLMQELPARNQRSSAQQDQPAPQSEREREVRQRPADGVGLATAPDGIVPVFALSVARSEELNLSRPANRIKLSPASKSIILLLELGPDPGLLSYRAVISTADGRSIWRESQLTPNFRDVLALSFNSSLFKPGNYLLTLEGLTADNRYVLAAQYTFQVIAQ
jgi:Putative zinc-finger